jgi:hypothetical protein
MFGSRYLAAALLLLGPVAVSGESAAPSDADSVAIALAELNGRALFDAARTNDLPDATLVAAARRLIIDFCPFNYRAVVLPGGDPQRVYFLADPNKTGNLVFGRHYRVEGMTVVPSTKACLEFPVNKNAAAAITTHLLSDTPTEFHVYLSLTTNLPIYVMTRSGSWAVEAGRIRTLEKQPAT